MKNLTTALKTSLKVILLLSFTVALNGCGGGGKSAPVTPPDIPVVTDPIVPDTTPPVITLIGEATISVKQNETFVEPGANALDNIDGAVDVVIEGTVNTSILDQYTLTYTATDAAGNQASATRIVNVVSTLIITGNAAAGGALVGKVIVKGANGNIESSFINTDGSFEVDVSTLTAPYRLRAEGRAADKLYGIHSYAQSSSANSVVNITPFTDLIIANATQDKANNFFFSASNTNINNDILELQESALQAKLQNLFDALNIGTDINLISTSFTNNNQGVDAALDIIDINISDNNIATITNLLDGSSITDDINQSNDNNAVINVDSEQVMQVVTEKVAIIELFKNFMTAINTDSPSSNDIAPFFSNNFLNADQTKTQFLDEILTNINSTDISIVSIAIDNLDITDGRTSVIFSFEMGDVINVDYEQWFVTKDETLGWQFSGDERIVDIQDLGFYCEQNNNIDTTQESCGLNVSFEDIDLTNNDTEGAAILSAKVEVLHVLDRSPRDTFYLGTPEGSSEVQVYHEGQQEYLSTVRPFGSAAGELEAIIFHTGDAIRYTLYQENLDLTNPTSPSVNVNTMAATYSRSVIYIPNTEDFITFSGKYPEYNQTSKDNINSFTLGNDLALDWTLIEGTYSREIIIEVSDAQGEFVFDLVEELNSSSTTSITFNAAAFNEALASNSNFDPTNGYSLFVMLVAKDISTGQTYLTNYSATVN